MQLQSYVQGRWHAGERDAQQLRDATTGQVDRRGVVGGHRFSRACCSTRGATGGPALRRAHVSRACGAAQAAREAAHGAARTSSTRCPTRPARPRPIPGSTSTAASARCSPTRAAARASCRTAACMSTATSKLLSKTGTFVGQHICVPLDGAAVHINAFNFPVWGMLEKLSPTLLAGMPAIVKPATTTAVSHRAGRPAHRRVGHPAGRRAAADLRQSRRPASSTSRARTSCRSRARRARRRSCACIRSSSRTRCASSARRTRSTPVCSAPDAAPGQPEFDAFVREVVREMTAKAGQKCTAIRKAHRAGGARRCGRAGDQGGAREDRRRRSAARAGAHGSARELWRNVARCWAASRSCVAKRNCVTGDAGRLELAGADREKGAFVAPSLLYCRDRRSGEGDSRGRSVRAGVHGHSVRRRLPRRSPTRARRGEPRVAPSSPRMTMPRVELVLGLAPFHGRLLIVNRDCAKESTGHGSPLPGLVHGGPGRAGGGEEMGGIRGAHALHAAHGGAGQSADDRGDHRTLGARRQSSERPACIRSARRSTSCDRRHAELGGTRSDARRHRALRGAERRYVLRAHGRGGRAAQSACSAGASRTAIS